MDKPWNTKNPNSSARRGTRSSGGNGDENRENDRGARSEEDVNRRHEGRDGIHRLRNTPPSENNDTSGNRASRLRDVINPINNSVNNGSNRQGTRNSPNITPRISNNAEPTCSTSGRHGRRRITDEIDTTTNNGSSGQRNRALPDIIPRTSNIAEPTSSTSSRHCSPRILDEIDTTTNNGSSGQSSRALPDIIPRISNNDSPAGNDSNLRRRSQELENFEPINLQMNAYEPVSFFQYFIVILLYM
ncbi:putative mediator of RNA polymerase II transcription subunit 29 [Halyomorpha halys]|uniref:putative mediator of RNA polymerase II transcription subunit 29 n=1 Tax=Halyomorpha halys TaxID=286706 RepID=UPI0034D292E3